MATNYLMRSRFAKPVPTAEQLERDAKARAKEHAEQSGATGERLHTNYYSFLSGVRAAQIESLLAELRTTRRELLSARMEASGVRQEDLDPEELEV